MNSGDYNFKEVAKNFVDGIKNELKGQIKAKIPDVGKYLSTNLYGGLAENSKEVVAAFEAMLDKLQYQRDFDLIDESEYYRQLETLRDRYFSRGSENWVKYTAEIFSYQKKTLEQEAESISGIYGEVAAYAEARMNEVIKRQQSAAEKLYATGRLFKENTVSMNGKTDVYYSLNDLEQDINLIRKYGEGLEELEKRAAELGISAAAAENIFDEIKNADFEDGYGCMRALLTADDKQFTAFAENLQLKKDLSEDVSLLQYEKEFEEGAQDALNNMKLKLEQAGYEIPEGFFASGGLSAQKFGEAFINELDTQLEIIRTRIEEFNASIGTGINQAVTENTYNTTNTSYNIQSAGAEDTVEQLKRYDTLKRLAGLK